MKQKTKGILQTERNLLLECINILKDFKVNEDTEERLETVYRFLEINNLSDSSKLRTAIVIMRENDDDDELLDEIEDLVNETILDLEFLVQQKYNKI